MIISFLSRCDFLEEVKWVGFGEFFDCVKVMYFKFYFYDVYWDFDVINDRIKLEFVGYDFILFVIKNWMDIVLGFLREINGMKINMDLLKFCERKVFV